MCIPIISDLSDIQAIQSIENLLNYSMIEANQRISHLLSSIQPFVQSITNLVKVEQEHIRWNLVFDEKSSSIKNIFMRCQHASCQSMIVHC